MQRQLDYFVFPPLCKHDDISLGPGFKSSEPWQGADRQGARSAVEQSSLISTSAVLSQLWSRWLCLTAGIKPLLSEETKAIFSAPPLQTVEDLDYNSMRFP